MRKTPLTLDQHRQIGRTLHTMYNLALSFACDLPLPKTHPVIAQFRREAKRLRSIRSILDDLPYRQYPGDYDPRVNYPGGRGQLPESQNQSALEKSL